MSVHSVLVNRLGCLSLPKNSVIRKTDRPDMTMDVKHGERRISGDALVNLKTTSCQRPYFSGSSPNG